MWSPAHRPEGDSDYGRVEEGSLWPQPLELSKTPSLVAAGFRSEVVELRGRALDDAGVGLHDPRGASDAFTIAGIWASGRSAHRADGACSVRGLGVTA